MIGVVVVPAAAAGENDHRSTRLSSIGEPRGTERVGVGCQLLLGGLQLCCPLKDFALEGRPIPARPVHSSTHANLVLIRTGVEDARSNPTDPPLDVEQNGASADKRSGEGSILRA